MLEGIFMISHHTSCKVFNKTIGVWGGGQLNSMLKGIIDMLRNVHVIWFRWTIEVSKLSRVFLQPIGRISLLLEWHSFLLHWYWFSPINLRNFCTSISFKESSQLSIILFFQGLYPVVQISPFAGYPIFGKFS